MNLSVYVYHPEKTISKLCLWLLRRKRVTLVSSPKKADVAIAPWLERKLTPEELAAPKKGTLIFHSSLLPRHRGKNPIEWAYIFQERYTGATWYWADEHLGTGDICEMEVLPIHPKESTEDFYIHTSIPSAIRMLQYILADLSQGIIRRRPQNHAAATYEWPATFQAEKGSDELG